MSLPAADTALYNHPLPEIEDWLISIGCEQDEVEPHCWFVNKSSWKAHVCLEVEELTVKYIKTDGDADIFRTFKYSLSRQDIENAVLAGP
jgi:hypothetical protein